MKIIKTIKNSHGFTLIELMITVAIVGILTAVALPAYQDYTVRSQVSEGLNLVSGGKPLVGEYFANHGKYPTNSDVGFNSYVGKYITKTEIGTNGKIIATFGNQANSKITGQTVTLSPETDTNTGNIKWSCGSSIVTKHLPTSCVNEISKSPLLTQSFTYDEYGNYYYKDGIVYMGEYEVEYYNIDDDGVMHFRHEHPQQINDLKLYPDGTIERITTIIGDEIPFQMIKTYPYDETSGIFVEDIYKSLHTFIENGVEKNYYFANPSVGFDYSDKGYEQSAKYSNLREYTQYDLTNARYYAQINNDITIYEDAIKVWKEKADEIKAVNGGKFPDDFPKAYLDFYNGNY